MLTFEKVLGDFCGLPDRRRDHRSLYQPPWMCKVEFDQDFHYCSGEVCHTPKELFNLLADDYRTYVEIE